VNGSLALRSRRVVTPGGIVAGTVVVANGRIDRVDAYDAVVSAAVVEDVGELVVLPGLVDTHVHIDDPGRSEWEGFDTATRAAAAGGVTTLMDMPLNSIPATTSLAALEAKAAAADGRVWVDVAFAGGVVPGNAGEIAAMARAGALAFKCFLTESGVPEFEHVVESDLAIAMPHLAKVNAPLLVHAELSGPIDAVVASRGNLSLAEARRYVAYLESRPKGAENEAVALMVRLAKEHGARTHVVHLSSADALVALRDARDAKVAIQAETCPHYLSLAAEDILDGATSFKCAPPIRERDNRDRLWRALEEGLVAQVVTDHSPSTPALKCIESGDFMQAWGGIASLELGLSIVWTEARARGRTLEDVVRWMCEAPARLVGLEGKKGAIAAGYDADLAVLDPDAERIVDARAMEQRHKLTPYDGKTLRGRVVATYLRGEKVFAAGKLLDRPRGAWVRGNA
jgi:allantoinase